MRLFLYEVCILDFDAGQFISSTSQRSGDFLKPGKLTVDGDNIIFQNLHSIATALIQHIIFVIGIETVSAVVRVGPPCLLATGEVCVNNLRDLYLDNDLSAFILFRIAAQLLIVHSLALCLVIVLADFRRNRCNGRSGRCTCLRRCFTAACRTVRAATRAANSRQNNQYDNCDELPTLVDGRLILTATLRADLCTCGNLCTTVLARCHFTFSHCRFLPFKACKASIAQNTDPL
nr:MAG TPA: hypothetical protein [Caudoviricetes sp.]